MKTILQKLFGNRNQSEIEKGQPFTASPSGTAENSRRMFMKKAAFGGIAMGGFLSLPVSEAVAMVTSNVQKASGPSDLKITDMRVAVITEGGKKTILRIDTNQGIYGLGEVRDGGDERYALFLKSRILGLNPCNVEMIFKIISQFGSHGRQGGGVCAVEMALWDLCGKAWGVPAWQLLGGRYRDTVRLYADTPEVKDPEGFAEKLKQRIDVQGFTWLKMDLGIQLVAASQDTVVNKKFWGSMAQYDLSDFTGYGNTLHPFTQIQITDKGIAGLTEYVEKVRSLVGYEIPLSADHFGHFDVNNSIRFGRAMEKYRLAWLEDMVPWFYTDQWKTVTDALETPTCTGEDIYMLKNGFKPLIDAKAVDIIHPDLATAGGLLETKKIGDYAADNGIAMAMHMAGSPVCFMANVHCAAATQNFLALEHHSIDLPWWENLVHVTGKKPLISNGYANVPLDSPGLGIELNEEEIKKHIDKTNPVFFDPTPEWDQKRSHDRIWS
jgi:L-alanine-DL-glutamate epimerase-like enolase superfamily enzyme